MRILDRAQSRIPQPWRTVVDWFATIAVAIAVVLVFQAEVAKPYRIPTPSMEPTLHCARPVDDCEGRFCSGGGSGLGRGAALHLARVDSVRSTGIDRGAPETVLELLAVRFEPHEAPSGDVIIDFAGGATLRLGVECLEAQLTDLGPAWSTARAPRHDME